MYTVAVLIQLLGKKKFNIKSLFYVRFDVGPILQQELCEVPKNCTADELGATLAVMGARLVNFSLPFKIYSLKMYSICVN